MKADNKIGPYKYIEFPETALTVVFSLIHAELDAFLAKVAGLRRAYAEGEAKGLLSSPPAASVAPFDSSLLVSSLALKHRSAPLPLNSRERIHTPFPLPCMKVSFHEELLLPGPVPVRKVAPLLTNPGGLMLTGSRMYFQPAQLNNVAEKVLAVLLISSTLTVT